MKSLIIGIGNIAQVHIKCLQHLGYEIIAICDKNIEKCYKALKVHGLESNVYTDYIKMLENEQADVVHICTPHFLHAEMIIKCMEYDLYVFTEKPLAISNEQIYTLENNRCFNPDKLGICFQNRMSPAVLYAKKFLNDKNITGITATLAWDRGESYYVDSDWKGKKIYEGGSVLINQAIHTIDLIRFFKGNPSSIISHLYTDILKDKIETEESAFVIFNYDDNSRAILNATNASTTYFDVIIQINTLEENSILLVGEEIYIDGFKIETEQNDYFFGKKAWGTNHLTCIKSFYDYIEYGGEYPIKYDDAAKTMKLLLECYSSCSLDK